VLEIAARHKGTSVVEVLQNCVIFNDGIHDEITNPKFRAERQLFLEHGKPMIFGNENDKGLVFESGKLKVVKIGENGYKPEDILVHDACNPDPTLHLALINMCLPDFPVAMGVIRNVEAPVYDEEMTKQIEETKKISPFSKVEDLLRAGNTWEVNDPGSTEPIPFFSRKCKIADN
jgi:2-oxoglutarate ferredoxin oxidoreductase subunit beta